MSEPQTPIERRRAVLTAIRNGAEKHRDIAKVSGVPTGSLANYLRALYADGLIQRETVTVQEAVTFVRYSAPME